MDISVIIPVKNEEKNVIRLFYELEIVLKRITEQYEIIFIDDGSTDNTFRVLKDLCKQKNNLKMLKFQNNFGKSNAYNAGFSKAKGQIIITMDGDLQDDPREIPRFLEAIKTKDLIVGWKFKRKDPMVKKIPSKIFNMLNKMLFGLKIHDSDCGYRAMKKEVAQRLRLHGDIYRYIPAIVNKMGYRIGEIKIKHHKRRHGKSKFGVSRLVTGALDLITVKFLNDFIKKPLHIYGIVGIMFFVGGLAAEFYVLFYRIVLNELFAKHMPMLMFGVLCLIIGIQFISIGLIGEIIAYQKTEKEYIIEQEIN